MRTEFGLGSCNQFLSYPILLELPPPPRWFGKFFRPFPIRWESNYCQGETIMYSGAAVNCGSKSDGIWVGTE